MVKKSVFDYKKKFPDFTYSFHYVDYLVSHINLLKPSSNFT
jgi:hypothetical protein